jgi:hypothetical protein
MSSLLLLSYASPLHLLFVHPLASLSVTTDEFLRSVGGAHEEHALFSRRGHTVKLNEEFSLDATRSFEFTVLALRQKRVDFVLLEKDKKEHEKQGQRGNATAPESDGATEQHCVYSR